jgi:hypothetical protein
MATTQIELNSAQDGAKEQLPIGIDISAVYLTNEAAQLCRVKPSTIRRAVRCGEIRGRGRPFRILGSELVKYVS